MRFSILLSLLSFLSLSIYAQDMPVSEDNGMVEYIEVVDVDGVSADELYQRAEKWFKEFYPNAGSVIETKESGKKIFGKHKIDLYADVKGNNLHQGFVNYYIEIGFKEGKYRYKLYNFYKLDGVKVFINKWIDSGASNQDVLNHYLNQVNEFTTELTSSLKETMNKPLNDDSGDDW